MSTDDENCLLNIYTILKLALHLLAIAKASKLSTSISDELSMMVWLHIEASNDSTLRRFRALYYSRDKLAIKYAYRIGTRPLCAIVTKTNEKMVKSVQGEEPKKKNIQDLPINKESANKLRSKGIAQVVNVYEKCTNQDEFCKWMMEECNANPKECEACYKAIRQNPLHWK